MFNLVLFFFFVSCVYGDPLFTSRPLLWERLIRIGIERKDSWCMLGDFSEILHNGEKLGGPKRSESSFKPFADMIRICGMNELPSVGNSFTWGGRRGQLWIQSKLDRCFGNKEWFRLFPASNQSFLDKRGSDHRPVLVKFFSSNESYKGNFKFDKRFLNKPMVKEAILRAWSNVYPSSASFVSDKLRSCRKALSKWKKENCLNSLDKINQLHVALEQEQSSSFPLASRVIGLKNQLLVAYREEESFWSQRSREKWMVEGESNTKFFHASVQANRSKKRIEGLTDVNGNIQKSEASKGEIAAAYFKELYKTSTPGNFHWLFHDFQPKVSQSMNETLIKPVSSDEIKQAAFSINPTSAPGPDGMTGLFFKNIGISLAIKSPWKFISSLFLVLFLLNGIILNYVSYQKLSIQLK